MDANILIAKITERGLNINETFEICEKICKYDKLTIGDAIRIKRMLDLSNAEAITVFLS